MGREMDSHIHDAQGTPNRLNPNRAIQSHITIILSKVKYKERILRAGREKRGFLQGYPVRQQISQQKFFRSEENEMTYSKH